MRLFFDTSSLNSALHPAKAGLLRKLVGSSRRSECVLAHIHDNCYINFI
jgi:hypothetical protein